MAGLLLSFDGPHWLSESLGWHWSFGLIAGWRLLVGLLFVTIIAIKADFES